MEALCFVARGKYQENKKVVGIATEMEIRPTCSHDFCLLEIDEWTEEHERQREQLQNKTGLLANLTERPLIADEYPEV